MAIAVMVKASRALDTVRLCECDENILLILFSFVPDTDRGEGGLFPRFCNIEFFTLYSRIL